MSRVDYMDLDRPVVTARQIDPPLHSRDGDRSTGFNAKVAMTPRNNESLRDYARQRSESGNGLAEALAAPPPVGEPQRGSWDDADTPAMWCQQTHHDGAAGRQ